MIGISFKFLVTSGTWFCWKRADLNKVRKVLKSTIN